MRQGDAAAVVATLAADSFREIAHPATAAPPLDVAWPCGLLDDSEYARWHDTAAGHLAAARYNADGGHHHVAVLLAEQACQDALKALLHGVGEATRARTHDLLALADACVELTGMPLDDELREAFADLARDYLPTRYPDALPAGTPQGHYGPRNAARALDTATRALELAETTWAALRAAATSDRP